MTTVYIHNTMKYHTKKEEKNNSQIHNNAYSIRRTQTKEMHRIVTLPLKILTSPLSSVLCQVILANFCVPKLI